MATRWVDGGWQLQAAAATWPLQALVTCSEGRRREARQPAQAKESNGGAHRRRVTEVGEEEKWLTGANGEDDVGEAATGAWLWLRPDSGDHTTMWQ
jgi:hypothetical protein